MLSKVHVFGSSSGVEQAVVAASGAGVEQGACGWLSLHVLSKLHVVGSLRFRLGC